MQNVPRHYLRQIENFGRRYNWTVMGKLCKELTVQQKKIILKLTSNNCTQEFIVNMLNVSQSCVCKFLKRWKYRQNVVNLHRTGRPLKSDDRGNLYSPCLLQFASKFSFWQIHRNANDVLPYLMILVEAMHHLGPIQFVISANACFLCHFTWRVILRFFSVIRFRWSASSMQIFHILSIFPSLQKFAYARLTYI